MCFVRPLQVLSNQKSFTVFAKSPEEKDAWVTAIDSAIRMCRNLTFKPLNDGEDAKEVVQDGVLYVPKPLHLHAMRMHEKRVSLLQ